MGIKERKKHDPTIHSKQETQLRFKNKQVESKRIKKVNTMQASPNQKVQWLQPLR